MKKMTVTDSKKLNLHVILASLQWKKPWTTDLANYRLQMSDVTINDLVIVMFIIKSQDY